MNIASLNKIELAMRRHKGGGGGTPVIPAPEAPAATQTSVEAVQAKIDTRRNARQKNGIQSTILAGNTATNNGGASGAMAQNQQGGKSALLGGG